MTYEPHPNDRPWWQKFASLLGLLDDAPADGTQLAVIQRDDVWVGTGSRYVACPQRGTHETLTDCWMCHNDVAWGHARAKDVLRAKSSR